MPYRRLKLSKVKNISGGPLDVPFLDRQVEADEVVDVPDYQLDGVSPIVWPPNRWEPVTDEKSPKRVSKADA